MKKIFIEIAKIIIPYIWPWGLLMIICQYCNLTLIPALIISVSVLLLFNFYLNVIKHMIFKIVEKHIKTIIDLLREEEDKQL